MSQSNMNQNSMTKQPLKSERKNMNKMLITDQIDKRTASDIEERIEELAKSYSPEWHYSGDERVAYFAERKAGGSGDARSCE